MGFLAANKIGPMICDMNVDVTFEGANVVLMQQVAKAMLDAYHAKGSIGQVRSPSVSLAHAGRPGPLLTDVGELLSFRDKALTAEVGAAVGAATKRGLAEGKVVGVAAADAFDECLDVVVELGWAHTDRLSFGNFVDQVVDDQGGGVVDCMAIIITTTITIATDWLRPSIHTPRTATVGDIVWVGAY